MAGLHEVPMYRLEVRVLKTRTLYGPWRWSMEYPDLLSLDDLEEFRDDRKPEPGVEYRAVNCKLPDDVVLL